VTAREEQAFAIIALIVVFFAFFVDVTEARDYYRGDPLARTRCR
jgi:hypothetical protein